MTIIEFLRLGINTSEVWATDTAGKTVLESAKSFIDRMSVRNEQDTLTETDAEELAHTIAYLKARNISVRKI